MRMLSARQIVVTLTAGAVVGTAATKPRAATGAGVAVSTTEEPSAAAPSSDSAFIGGGVVAAFLGVTPEKLVAAAATTRWRLDDVIIATVADPVDSHLDWLWDAQFEAIRRGFEQARYVTDRFVLPTTDLTIPPASRARIDTPSPLRNDLGVILFRRVSSDTNGISLVYLVGETPTSGVHKPALTKALRERARLLKMFRSARGDTLRIIGPTFSGSAHSLLIGLRGAASLRDSFQLLGSVVSMISGTATSYEVKSVLSTSGIPGVDFTYTAAIHPDLSLLSILFDRILPDLRLSRDQLAILSESSTGYGQTTLKGDLASTGRDSSRPLQIPFPAGFSRVRNLYEGEAELRETAKKAINLTDRARPSISTADPPRALEDLPSTTALTPVAVDAMVDQIAQTLAERQIRVVAIVATDVRDKLFIMSEVRRRIGDAQFVIFGSNVLLQRTDWNAAMHGALVLSTYPVAEPDIINLEVDPHWAAFSSDEAAGTYNATILQLKQPGLLVGYPPDRPLPHVWATVVGRGRLYRLSAYDENRFAPCYLYAKGKGPECLASDAPLERPATTQLGLQYSEERERFASRPSFALALAAGLLVFGVAWWVLRFRQGVVPPSATGEPLRTGVGVEDHRWLQLQARGFLIVAVLTAFATATTIVAAVIPQSAREWARDHPLWAAVLPLVVVLAIWYVWVSARKRSLLWVAGELRKLSPGDSHTRINYGDIGRIEVGARIGLVVIGIASGIVGLVYAWVVVRSNAVQMNRFNDIGSFVSPILFVLIGGAALAFLCLWELSRVQGLLMATPLERALQAAKCGKWKAEFPLSVLVDKVGDLREALFKVMPGVSAAVLLVVGIALYRWLRHTITIEALSGGSLFSLILSSTILGLILVGAWAIFRLAAVWGSAEAVLKAVKSTEFAPALKDVAKTRVPHSWAGFSQASDADPSYFPVSFANLWTDPPPGVDLGPRPPGIPHQESRKAAIATVVCAFDKPGIPPDSAWLVTARRYLAEECCLYLEWVEQHVRNFVYLVAGALFVGPLLLNAFPFYPQRRAEIAFATLFISAILVIMLVVVRQNRDELLSTINGTTPGRLTLNSGFVRIVLLAIMLPLLSFVMSEAPKANSKLLSWATPLLEKFVQ